MKKTITIVWWWTSWWLTWSILLKWLWDNFNITLISDEKLWNIWVWEATIPCIKNVFSFLWIDERDWLSYCNWTFKYWIKFEKWNNKKSFTHPYYDTVNDENYKEYIKYWLYWKAFWYIDYSFDYYTSLISQLMHNKWYLEEIDKDISYHFDTNKLGIFLKEWSLNKGIKYLNANITKFNQDSLKNINSVTLSDWRVIDTDFIIDCSWFKSLVLEWVYNEPFIPFNDTLTCDKCMVRWFKYSDDNNEREPYTTSVAMNNWWMWKIPLKDRLSVWYVFSSKHWTYKEIEEEILEEIKLEPLNDFRLLNIKTWYHKKACIKNSFAIGLSYWFIEPLESTGIFFIYSSVFKLLDIFNNIDNEDIFNNKKELFNTSLEAKINDIKDFVLFHYLINEKEGEFWKDSRNVKIDSKLENIVKNFSFYWEKFSFDKYYTDKYNVEPFFKDLSYYYIFSWIKNLKDKDIKNFLNNEDIKNNHNTYKKWLFILIKKYENMKLKLNKIIKYNDYLDNFYKNK